ncbi:MAG: hypothetical protein ACKVYV_13540 [Limisphaerales bacterium]
MKSIILPVAASLAASALALSALAAPLFSDDFNDAAVSAGKWTVFNGHYAGDDDTGVPWATNDYRVEWAYDYAALTYTFFRGNTTDTDGPQPVPPAPKTRDGTKKGVRIQVNKFNDQPSFDAVNLYAKGLNATGNFVLKFDLFLNHPSFADSGSGTTEYALMGLNFTGTNVNWTTFGTAPGFLASPAGQHSDGFYFMTTGDGGAGRNQRLAVGRSGAAAADPQTTTVPEIQALAGVFPDRDGGGVADNLLQFSDYSPFKQRLFATPRSEFRGIAGKRWIEVELIQLDGVITWKMDGLTVARFANSTPHTAGTVMIGYMDIFSSITGPGQEEKDQQWALFDNLSVEPIRTVTVTTANNASTPGDGLTSLLEALTDLQDNDRITFNIPSANALPVVIRTPQDGYPLIGKHNVTLAGYTQPGASPNTNAPSAGNNAVIKVYLDSRSGPGQRTVLDFPGFGKSESAILGVRNGRNFEASGLGFLSRFTAGNDDDAVIYGFALVSDSPGAHFWGNHFGFVDATDIVITDPVFPVVNGYLVAGGRSAVASFRDGDIYSSGLTFGVDGDGYGDAGEANVSVGMGLAVHLETPDARVSGNYLNVFPDRSFFDAATVPFYDDKGDIEAIENGKGDNMLIGTDGDRVSDTLEGNFLGPVRYPTFTEFWRPATNIIYAGNSVGIGPSGTTYTNSAALVQVRRDSWIRIGSDFNGDPTVAADAAVVAADMLEANRIHNLSVPLINLHGSNNDPDTEGNKTRAARVAVRGNHMVNNFGSFPISVGQNVEFTTFFAPLLTDADTDNQPVLSTNSTVTTLEGAIPAFLDTAGVTEKRLEVYRADPLGRSMAGGDYPDGWLQGKEFLAYYFVDGGDDSNADPLKFTFDVTALNLTQADLDGLTVVAAYYVPTPWGLPPIVRTSRFSATLGEPVASNPSTLAVTKSGTSLVFTATGGTGPFQLQSRPEVGAGAWNNVGAAGPGPFLVPAPAVPTFYRVAGQ